MNTLFSSPAARERILELYFDKLEELNISYDTCTIETSFGDTHIIMTGDKTAPPLVLLHGANGCAPIAIEALPGLLKDFRVYAIDIIGQPNPSAEFRPDIHTPAYGQWLQEILSRMHITGVTLVGISFGGLVSWKTLAFDERRIARAFLIVPAGIVNGNPIQALWKVFLPMKRYMATRKTKYVHRFLGALFTREDPFALRFLSEVFLHFSMDFSPLPLISRKEAAQIKTPVYIAAAENDLMFPGKKLLRRAQKIFPSLRDTLLLPDSRHVPDEAGNEEIVKWISKNYGHPQEV
ncbi:alpha/beta fold hydrolase [Flavilitoribacter nigricans]|uniref:Alpha/beta hydrolase n=1 Tax=Flavilitoribacter nigricans (strain ATCC 23147 / DSM 23189 / NBRC 102662 / NCIMB 1420 / SS-2) TaxID=1122177 RepID=A0A2D0N692_FLAN2|nr:alpha/beta fold hydrolase [Flavilitoribacter nigricans]PHN03977.1 alpha/beta hydrolase [Flavilitoribacter nigricans DSM 23189 = NBRC 102662]